ncbi:MAG: isoprenyl transferase [Anaerolineae bacterium]
MPTEEREPLTRVPTHVAIIMDGNGRWAKAHGLPRVAGHRAGTENIRRILEACVDFGVKILTIYAFSTENWSRPPEEVESLMRLFGEVIDRETKRLKAQGVQIRHVGSLDRIPEHLKTKMLRAVDETKDNDRLILNVAFNYGGRAEIVNAVRRIIADGLTPEQVTEEVFSSYLYTAGLPDPDLIIRTAGEMRLSNFLIWQSAYAEYYSTPVYWPDFDREELYKALLAYSQRERRYGRVLDQ